MNKYLDNYDITSLNTKVKDYKDGYYTFEETIFYGEKGGMKADEGTINDIKVIELKWDGDILLHKLEKELDNDEVFMQVDRNVRQINTSVQSALHLLDGYYRNFDLYLPSVGVDANNEWYEVNTKDIDENHLNDVQNFMNKAIEDDIKMDVKYIKGSEYDDPNYQNFDELRIISFGNLDSQPCGTLHVNSTKDIYNFTILDYEKTSRGTKVYFTCGLASNNILKENYLLNKELAKTVGVKKGELLEKTNLLVQNNKELKKELQSLKTELANYKAKEFASLDNNIIDIQTKEVNDIRTIATSISGLRSDDLIIYSLIDNTIHFAIISNNGKARDIFNEFKSNLDANGGGSPKIASGKINISLEEFIKFANETL